MNPAFCPSCGARTPTHPANYCAVCGFDLTGTGLGNRSAAVEEPNYPSGLIFTTRLMAALCMFSAMAAVLRFETTTLTGRILAISSIMVAFTGQLFALQSSKSDPPTWAIALLPMFWIGVAALVVMWLVALA